jgi:hypothetical protein
MAFASQRLENYCKRNAITNKVLGNLAGISTLTAWRLRHLGPNDKQPTLTTIQKLANALNINPRLLIEDAPAENDQRFL